MARDAEKETFWQGKMTEYGTSGLTVREFCARCGLREVQFYYWRRALKAAGKEKEAGFVELRRPAGANGAAGVSGKRADRDRLLLGTIRLLLQSSDGFLDLGYGIVLAQFLGVQFCSSLLHNPRHLLQCLLVT